eukprot:6077847-Alexandrium_andersonii.AAC.1
MGPRPTPAAARRSASAPDSPLCELPPLVGWALGVGGVGGAGGVGGVGGVDGVGGVGGIGGS